MQISKYFKNSLIILLIFFMTDNYAQENLAPTNCNLSGFLTFSQGGWGSSSNGLTARIRDQHFSTVFPEGLTVGSDYTLRLNTSASITLFLPQGHMPSKFNDNYIDVKKTSAGILGGQLVTAILNYSFNLSGFLGDNPDYTLGDLIITSGTFAGYSVEELISVANSAIGGEETQYKYSEINEALSSFNENFENGKDKGFLKCPAAKKMVLSGIGDKVWLDVNRNGTQEIIEPGIAGVAIKLFNCSDELVSETFSGSDGYYLFNVSPGSYYIQVSLPDYHYFTYVDQFEDGIDSDVDPSTGKSGCINISVGENNLSVDIGIYNYYSSIGDRVWLDTDNDGVQTRYDAGLMDVVVNLCNCEDAVLAQTLTDASGKYFFYSVVPGFYKIQFVLPQGYVFTRKNQGVYKTSDSDAGTDGFTDCTELAPNENDYSWDAGLIIEAGNEGGDLKTIEYVNKSYSKFIGELPAEFTLMQNYPNPFNPSTVITFSIPEEGNYSLKIFNLLGQEVSTLFTDYFNPGKYSVIFNGKDLLSGMYFYNLSGDNVSLTQKMTLIK